MTGVRRLEPVRQVLHRCECCGQPVDDWQQRISREGVSLQASRIFYKEKALPIMRGTETLLRLLFLRGRASKEAFMIASNSDATVSTANVYVCHARRALKWAGGVLQIATIHGWGYELRYADGRQVVPDAPLTVPTSLSDKLVPDDLVNSRSPRKNRV